jgi:hypothetical protein
MNDAIKAGMLNEIKKKKKILRNDVVICITSIQSYIMHVLCLAQQFVLTLVGC